MIQKCSKLSVIDNSGARIVSCIHIPCGYKCRYAFIKNVIVVSVKKLRNKTKAFFKSKKR